ncbi:MAG TPA: Gfo/Idh/MocA family oxidoreductase [Vicinamibacterales bacterium]
MQTRPRAVIVGTGFMGRVHLEALRRLGFVDVVAVVGTTVAKARALADAFGIDRATDDHLSCVTDPSIHAVHICTPNSRHFAIAAAALDAGRHVLCEKPLAMTSAEAARLMTRAAEQRLRNCTCHNLRFYPMVQQMRRMREAGELGEILIVQGTYSQDWLLFDTDWNWRVERQHAGPLRAMGDIGSHWCDMMEHVTGLRIRALCADLATFHETRKRPAAMSDTFTGKASGPREAVDAAVDTEDFGSVLLRVGERARGAFTVSQVSAGCKNRLSLEVFGTKASVAWNQERPDELWIGRRDQANEIVLKDPSLLAQSARSYSDLPGGHSEGYDDTFKQLFRRFYQSILDPGAVVDYPQFSDGLRQMQLLEATLASHERRGWVELVGD